jgi:hypothetical protein
VSEFDLQNDVQQYKMDLLRKLTTCSGDDFVKNSTILLSFIAALNFFSGPAMAAQYSYTGTISKVRSHDYQTYGTDRDWFQVTGFTSAGACPIYPTSGGQVILVVRDDIKGQRMFKGVLLAESTGRTVTVYVDDTRLNSSGFCFVDYMDFNP